MATKNLVYVHGAGPQPSAEDLKAKTGPDPLRRPARDVARGALRERALDGRWRGARCGRQRGRPGPAQGRGHACRASHAQPRSGRADHRHGAPSRAARRARSARRLRRSSGPRSSSSTPFYEHADRVARRSSAGVLGIGFPDFIFRKVVGFFASDVVDYLFNGFADEMQAEVRKVLLAGPAPEVIIAHSLGTIVTYDVLSEPQLKDRVPSVLVTVGCPLGIDNVQKRLRNGAGRPNPIPARITTWSNFADRFDPVAIEATLRDEFKPNDLIVDDEVNNRAKNNHDIDGYLTIVDRSLDDPQGGRGGLGHPAVVDAGPSQGGCGAPDRPVRYGRDHQDAGEPAANPLLVDATIALGLSALSLLAVASGATDAGGRDPLSVALLLLETLPLVVPPPVADPGPRVTLGATVLHASLVQGQWSTRASGRSWRCSPSPSATTGASRSRPGSPWRPRSLAVIVVEGRRAGRRRRDSSRRCCPSASSWALGDWARTRRRYAAAIEENARLQEAEREERVAARRPGRTRADRPRAARHRDPSCQRDRHPGRGRPDRARPAPEQARTALEAIDRTSREALTDMRRMLGILGERPTPTARRRSRERRCPASSASASSSRRSAPPASRSSCPSRATAGRSTPASSCPPTGSSRRP